MSERLYAVVDMVGAAIVVATPATIEVRIEAVGCYASQVPTIFRFTDDFRGAMRQFAVRIGDGVAAERFWPVLARALPGVSSVSPP